MPNRFTHVPTYLLENEVQVLERKLLEGVAAAHEIEAFVVLAAEIGRRAALAGADSCVLDGIVDPRD